MQVLQQSSQLDMLPKADLPSRVVEEVFPLFERILTPSTHVIVGVSTGGDSMTLACLLHLWYVYQQRGFGTLHIVHCNHTLRAQSEYEVAYVKRFFSCEKVQIFIRPDKVKTDERSLRIWRYACFQQSSATLGTSHQTSAILFLGHHLEDRIETTFLHCIRGAGLQGFLNMQLLQSHSLLGGMQVCRPLLNSTKQQILAFCEQFGIQYFEDETNTNITTSQRNFIRHEILGKLVGMNEGKSRFLESMKHIYAEIEPRLPVELISFPPCPARNAEYAYRTSSTHIVDIWRQLRIATNLHTPQIKERTQRLETTKSGRKHLHSVYFFCHQQQLFIIKAPTAFWTSYLLDEHPITQLGYQTIAGITVHIEEERLIGATLRFPKANDRFAGKTWNRRCINQKIPVFWRNFIPLAVKDGNIIHMWKQAIQ